MKGTLLRVTMAVALAAALLAPSGTASAANEKDVTTMFFLPAGTNLQTETLRLVVTSKSAGKVKLKSCTSKDAKSAMWNFIGVDGRGNALILTGAAPDIKKAGGELTSIRAEGECKEGGTTWLKYSGVLSKEKPTAGGNPATAATPKPKDDGKKKDGKGK